MSPETQPDPTKSLIGCLGVLFIVFVGGWLSLYYLTRPKTVEYSPQLQACLDAIPKDSLNKAANYNCHRTYGK